MGSVPNCQKEIADRYPIRWFKCKLKPPKKGVKCFSKVMSVIRNYRCNKVSPLSSELPVSACTHNHVWKLE